MKVNDIQIGGEHYRKKYQHWDWVADNNIGYHAGNATKYIFRWREKNGLQDLEKASHYIDKLFELFKNGKIYNHSLSVPNNEYSEQAHLNTKMFIIANNLDAHQAQLMNLLDGWSSMLHLREAKMVLQEYMRTATEQLEGSGAGVTPSGASRAAGGAKTGGTGASQGATVQGAASSASTELPKRQSTEHPAPFGYDGEG